MEDFQNYRNYKTQDFVWDDAFRSWVLETKPEDTLYWTQFMVQFPDREAEINLAKDIILRMTVNEPVLSETEIHDITEMVMQKTSSSASRPKNTARASWKTSAPIGMAALAFTVVIILLIHIMQTGKHTTSQLTESTFTTKTNSSGHPMEIILADQSKIILENESSIRYPQAFASNDFREVHLAGNAFFEVAKDASRPFLVYSNGIVTKVLGTSFRIHAPKSGDERSTVEVVSGIVAVYPVGDHKPQEVITKNRVGEVILTRNQKAEYSKTRNNLVTVLVDDPIPAVTTQATQRFVNHPILDILDVLKSDYGIDIIHDDHLLVNRTLTADLSGLTMYQKLDVICQAINASYEVIDGKIIIL